MSTDKEIQKKYDELEQRYWGMIHNLRNVITSGVIVPSEVISRELSLVEPDLQTIRYYADIIKHSGQTLRAYSNNNLLSNSGTIENWKEDVANQKRTKKGLPLPALLLSGLRSAVANMFDRKYFSTWADLYYPDNTIWSEARQAFLKVPPQSLEALKKFMNTYMTDNINVFFSSDTVKFIIGDERLSCFRMQLLLEELCLNALKAMAFCDKSNRSLIIDLRIKSSQLKILISNSYHQRDNNGSGQGTSIINRVLHGMGGELSQEIDAASSEAEITIKI